MVDMSFRLDMASRSMCRSYHDSVQRCIKVIRRREKMKAFEMGYVMLSRFGLEGSARAK